MRWSYKTIARKDKHHHCFVDFRTMKTFLIITALICVVNAFYYPNQSKMDEELNLEQRTLLVITKYEILYFDYKILLPYRSMRCWRSITTVWLTLNRMMSLLREPESWLSTVSTAFLASLEKKSSLLRKELKFETDGTLRAANFYLTSSINYILIKRPPQSTKFFYNTDITSEYNGVFIKVKVHLFNKKRFNHKAVTTQFLHSDQ